MNIINAMELRELIRKLRLRKGWSQAELAKKAGVSSGTIGTIESENRMPYIKTLKKIADALGVTVEYILRETGEVAEEKPKNEIIAEALHIDPEVWKSLSEEEKEFILRDAREKAEFFRKRHAR